MVGHALSPRETDRSVESFRESMPPSYRRAHGTSAIREHAAIVGRRGEAAAQLEVWRVRRGTVVVVVADDRADGLAMMSAAIAASGFDILMAEAYRRAVEGRPGEAVALFELRRTGEENGPIGQADLVPVARALESLLAGQDGAEGVARRNATVGGRVRDRFEITEMDGTTPSDGRRAEIARSVLGAVEHLGDAGHSRS